MNSRDVITNTIRTADMICGAYLADLTDDEMFRRPHAECNHINWQVGHLIASDQEMVNGCCPGTLPPLPEGFAEKYGKETKDDNDPSHFHTKAELLELLQRQHEAIVDKLSGMTDDDLDAPSPEAMQAFAPNTGAAFNMIGMHWLMHCGQWVPVRRETGKEIVI